MPIPVGSALKPDHWIAAFSQKRVVLVGDAILDMSTYGHRLGISAETPTIVASEERVEYSFGGASLVARNLLELGAAVDYVTVLGDDGTQSVYRTFSHSRLSAAYIAEAGRRSTVKKRFWVDGYKLLQFDVRDDRDIQDPTASEVLRAVEDRLPGADALIIADNRHGVLVPDLISRLLAAAKRSAVAVYVDSQASQRSSNHHLYQGADVVCCNQVEARAVVPDFNPEDLEPGLKVFRRALNAGVVVVKLGPAGCAALADGECFRQLAHPAQPVDTCGAGDAFLAALCLAQDAPWSQALWLANCWAALSTEQRGPNPPSLKKLSHALRLRS